MIGFGRDGGDGNVAPGVEGIGFHFVVDLLSGLAVGEAFQKCGGAAVERPLGEPLGENGAAALIGINIEFDVNSGSVSVVDFVDGLLLGGPIGAKSRTISAMALQILPNVISIYPRFF